MAWPVLPHGFLGTAAVTGDEDTYQVERSLRFNSADSAYLSRTPSSASNRKTWTWSGWVKRSNLGTDKTMFDAGNNDQIRFISANPDRIRFNFQNVTVRETNAVYRDTSSWYHIVLAVDTTSATANDRIRLYVNGSEVTSFATLSNPAQNADGEINSTSAHSIGRVSGGTLYFDGYMAEIHFIDGQALTPSSFGETDAITGRWKAKAYSGTYGTNGFYLPFSNNASTTQLGLDGKSDAITGSTGASPILNISGRSASSGVNSDSNSTSLVFAASLNSDANLTVDHSPSGRTSSTKTITNTSVTLDSNIYKLYSGSALFNGTTARLSVPNSADFQFGTGDFTIEGWVNPVALKANGIFAKCSVDASWATGWTCEIDNGYITFYDGSVRHSSATNLLAINNWYHVAWARQGSTLRMFVNGNLAHTATTSINLVPTSSFTVCNDSVTTTYAQNARVQDVRIYKGLAKYTAAFTPPRFNDWVLNNFSVTAGVGNDSFVDSPTNYGALTHTFSDDTYQISRSLRFNSADSAYLSRTPSSSGNRRTFTWSGWIKRTSLSPGTMGIFEAATNANNRSVLLFLSNDTIQYFDNSAGSTITQLITNPSFKDFSVWNHFVLAVDTTQATAANRVKLYVNGIELTSFSTATYPTQNFETQINLNVATVLGAGVAYAPSAYINAYITEVHLIDGQALTPDSFGVRDANTYIWKPKAYTGTYGTNGFYLNFSDNSGTTSTTLGKDQAGSNNWTPSGTPGFSVASGIGNDSLVDTPTYYGTDAGAGGEARGDYCTLDPNFKTAAITLTNGNLDYSQTASAGIVFGTIPVSSGKWYWEMHPTASRSLTGIAEVTTPVASTYVGSTAKSYGYYSFNGNKYNNGANSAYGATFTSGDIVGVALNLDAGTLEFFKNNVSQGVAFTGISGTFVPAIGDAIACSAQFNFGQRPFTYTAPSGFKALRDYNRQLVPTGGVIRGNYATMNALAPSKPTLLNGALQTNAGNLGCINTFGMTTGKWFCEMDVVTVGAESSVGVSKGGAMSTFVGASADSWGYYSGGPKYNNGSGTTYGASFTSGDTIGCAFDADLGLLSFYKNGVYQGVAFSGLTSGPYFFSTSGRTSTAANNVYINFGQRPWVYGPPAGFRPVCSTSIPQPTIQKASSYMDVVRYTGTGATQTIGGLGFSPDLVWVKDRSITNSHNLFDSVRPGFRLRSDSTAAEAATTVTLGSSGFTLGTETESNNNTSLFVGWAWDEAQIAGLDIINYVGDGVAGRTVAHNLGVAPKFIIVKNRVTAGFDLVVYHANMNASPQTGYISLNATLAFTTLATVWNNTAPTASVFTLGSNTAVNKSGENHIAYVFAEVEGFSKFGSYTGNASADGPFVWCGFRPRWVMMKRIDAAGKPWCIHDTARDIQNVSNSELEANSNTAENGGTYPGDLDILANGFKPREGGTAWLNESGTFIFAAFAESPFKYARAR